MECGKGCNFHSLCISSVTIWRLKKSQGQPDERIEKCWKKGNYPVFEETWDFSQEFPRVGQVGNGTSSPLETLLLVRQTGTQKTQSFDSAGKHMLCACEKLSSGHSTHSPDRKKKKSLQWTSQIRRVKHSCVHCHSVPFPLFRDAEMGGGVHGGTWQLQLLFPPKGPAPTKVSTWLACSLPFLVTHSPCSWEHKKFLAEFQGPAYGLQIGPKDLSHTQLSRNASPLFTGQWVFNNIFSCDDKEVSKWQRSVGVGCVCGASSCRLREVLLDTCFWGEIPNGELGREV